MASSANPGPIICGVVVVIGGLVQAALVNAPKLDTQGVLAIVGPIVVVVLILVGLAVKALLDWDERRETARDNAKVYAQRLAHSADYQHQQLMEGDPRKGAYGGYDPASRELDVLYGWDDDLDWPSEVEVAEPKRVDHDMQRCHCNACAAARQATGAYVYHHRRQHIGGDRMVTCVDCGTVLRPPREPVAVVRAFGERDLQRVIYSPSELSQGGASAPDEDDDFRDWYDER